MRFSLVTLYGSGFEGGHLTRKGNAPDGTPVETPLYRHEVSLDYARVELELQYALSESWDLALRVPWQHKDQTSAIAAIEPASAAELEAMQRNADIHHRGGTFRGLGDLMLLGRRHRGNLHLAAGLTLPTGGTVENPYHLGDQGLEHLHIQFGSGTFDPLLEASYVRPLGERFASSASFAGRFPFYANRHRFRAPAEGSVAVTLSQRTTERVRLRVEAAGYAQGYGYWDGRRDENTGLYSVSIGAGATVRLRSVSLSMDVRYPLAQRTLSEGDAFEQGPTFAVSVGGPLRISSAP